MFKIIYLNGTLKGKEIILTPEKVVKLGRDESSDIVLSGSENQTVSRQHSTVSMLMNGTIYLKIIVLMVHLSMATRQVEKK